MKYSAKFDAFYERHLMIAEGGRVNHKNDRGGLTQFGVSEEFLKEIGRGGERLTPETAKAYMYEFFWEANDCESMDELVAWCYCDALVNHTPRSAAKMLQNGLGVTVDGVVGPQTLKAAESVNRRVFIERYRVRRMRHYAAIVKRDPNQGTFLVGWVDRLFRLQQALLSYGLFSKEVKSLAWYSPDNYSATTKSSAMGLAMFAAVIGLFFPELNVETLIRDPEALKAAVIGIATTLIAKWRSKTE